MELDSSGLISQDKPRRYVLCSECLWPRFYFHFTEWLIEVCAVHLARTSCVIVYLPVSRCWVWWLWWVSVLWIRVTENYHIAQVWLCWLSLRHYVHLMICSVFIHHAVSAYVHIVRFTLCWRIGPGITHRVVRKHHGGLQLWLLISSVISVNSKHCVLAYLLLTFDFQL